MEFPKNGSERKSPNSHTCTAQFARAARVEKIFAFSLLGSTSILISSISVSGTVFLLFAP
ncbi:hypothetical protein M103_1143 [Bacteroides fragilis str. 1007-1-F |nr:hypothetical protein M120_5263 [Bacteroides fragilis str. 3783N1-8]EYA20643.1 hypothetical protein M146_1161 [Bacteroides fragilis str. 1007-1-F \